MGYFLAALRLNVQVMIIEGDSKMAVKQMEGWWNVHRDHLQTLLDEIDSLYASVPNIQKHHIPRENNAADCNNNRFMKRRLKILLIKMFLKKNRWKIIAHETPKFYAIRFEIVHGPNVYSTEEMYFYSTRDWFL